MGPFNASTDIALSNHLFDGIFLTMSGLSNSAYDRNVLIVHPRYVENLASQVPLEGGVGLVKTRASWPNFDPQRRLLGQSRRCRTCRAVGKKQPSVFPVRVGRGRP